MRRRPAAPRTELRSGAGAFTLIEMLLVIGIIAVLAATTIVALNPSKNLGDARNAQRRSDVNAIINAVYQYSIDNQGQFPAVIPAAKTEICANKSGESCTGVVDLSLLVDTYLAAMPVDPKVSDPITQHTDYSVLKTATNRITVFADAAENNATISVTR